ncbi:MAG TPA: hypothetical protein VFE13_17625 [Caulobacteraceae bacterium]|nr:hypothetical protein [Caulobacteraceae bacterium]
MTLEEVLNLDVAAIGEGVGRGLRWWVDELAELAPVLRTGERASARPVLEFSAGGGARLWRQGRCEVVGDAAALRGAAVDVALPAGVALDRRVTLPDLRLDDLVRLVANDIDRLTPFRAEQVYFALELEATAGERREARLAVVRRPDAEAALSKAQQIGAAPARLGVASDDGQVVFDFLPAIRAAGRGGRSDRGPLIWWSAVAACLALNVGLLIFKDSYDVASLKNLVDLQQPSVSLALKLRQRVEGEMAGRQALLARRAHEEPLRILDAVTRALPAPQSLQRLEWNGRSVRLVGFRDPHFDVLAPLQKTGLLTRPRAASSGEPATPRAQPSFDVVADLAESARR